MKHKRFSKQYPNIKEVDIVKVRKYIRQRNTLLQLESNSVKKELDNLYDLKSNLDKNDDKQKERYLILEEKLKKDIILLKGRIREVTKFNVLFDKKWTKPKDVLENEDIFDYFIRWDSNRIEYKKQTPLKRTIEFVPNEVFMSIDVSDNKEQICVTIINKKEVIYNNTIKDKNLTDKEKKKIIYDLIKQHGVTKCIVEDVNMNYILG